MGEQKIEKIVVRRGDNVYDDEGKLLGVVTAVGNNDLVVYRKLSSILSYTTVSYVKKGLEDNQPPF